MNPPLPSLRQALRPLFTASLCAALAAGLAASTGCGNSSGSGGSSAAGSTGGTSSGKSSAGGTSSGGSTGPLPAAAFAYCSQPVFLPDNGDLGQPCTPGPNGKDAGQGSCGPTELCVDYRAGPVCTFDCSASECPGTTQCFKVGLATGGAEDLCVESCLVDAGSCSSGMACVSNTPNPVDPGACLPTCARNADCNSADAGTNWICGAGGSCQCTRNSDCDGLPDAGLMCDTSSGACYLPCSPNKKSSSCIADNYSFGCCAQTGSLDYCDLMLPPTGWEGGGAIFDAGFCPAPATAVDNMGIGASCTPPSDGSTGAGSCASGQLCEDLGAGPQCTFDCSGGSCPGSSWCSPGQRLCLPSCSTAQDAGCAAGEACQPITPNPADLGYCTKACGADGDCNPSGTSTALTCAAGVCTCSTNTDCGLGRQCDTASGACYIACGPSIGVGCDWQYGCCAQVGDVGYCDSLASPSPAGFAVGPHNPWPGITNPEGGPVLANIQLVSITFNPWKDNNGTQSYPFQQQLEDYGTWLVTSPWYLTIGADYGIGPGTAVSKRLSEAPPTLVQDDSQHRDVQAFLNRLIAAKTVPAPGVNTLYVVYYPFTTTILSGAGQSCQSYGGYHSVASTPTTSYAYAVLPDCGSGGASGWDVDYSLQGIEAAVSHEITEAATDPTPPSGNDPQSGSWTMHNLTSPWAQSALGNEVGDICINIQNHWVDPATGNIAQRIWSIGAAHGNGSPCGPVLVNQPFADASGPLTILSASPGTNISVPYQAWSTAPVPNWPLVLFQLSGGPQVGVSPQELTVNNNQSGSFQVSVPGSYLTGDQIQMALVSLTTPDVDTEWWPVVIKIK